MLTLGIQSREEAQQPPREAMGRSSSQQPVPTSSQDESSDGPGTQSGHFWFSGYPSWYHVIQTVSEKPCSDCRIVRKINVFSHLVWGVFFLCGAWIPLPKPVYPSSSYCECGLLRSCGHALPHRLALGWLGSQGRLCPPPCSQWLIVTKRGPLASRQHWFWYNSHSSGPCGTRLRLDPRWGHILG